MNEILILSKKDTDELIIANKLKSVDNFDVKIANSAQEAADRIKEKPFDLVIFNLKNFNADKLKMAQNLRRLGHNFPLMALAPDLDFTTLLKIEALPNTVLLEKPYTDKDLIGLSQKLIYGKKVFQRIYRRYSASQIANIEIYPTGERLDSHIFNLSQGGAYIEVPKEVSFEKGDLVKLDVKLRKINKQHGIHAKVVWTDGRAIWNKGKAVGIEFIKSEEVYAHMLDNI